jgi:hypothetical protein
MTKMNVTDYIATSLMDDLDDELAADVDDDVAADVAIDDMANDDKLTDGG